MRPLWIHILLLQFNLTSISFLVTSSSEQFILALQLACLLPAASLQPLLPLENLGTNCLCLPSTSLLPPLPLLLLTASPSGRCYAFSNSFSNHDHEMKINHVVCHVKIVVGFDDENLHFICKRHLTPIFMFLQQWLYYIKGGIKKLL